ncbi:MAG: hypothetical protein HRT74_13050, partial [Flavobacteriales bacterium]|nr:hypothetical protein [Flavobacteriales bacterium]
KMVLADDLAIYKFMDEEGKIAGYGALDVSFDENGLASLEIPVDFSFYFGADIHSITIKYKGLYETMLYN